MAPSCDTPDPETNGSLKSNVAATARERSLSSVLLVGGWTAQRSAGGEGYSAVNLTQRLMGEVELLDSLWELAEFVQSKGPPEVTRPCCCR